MEKKAGNSHLYPEAWKVFVEAARSFPENKPEERYGIPDPTNPKEYIWATDSGILFHRFRLKFYEPNLNSLSVYGKIQHIVTHF